ncbi:sigma-70 family RNA polymerase sigma factor [Clostridium sp.]|uniref:sigma-70 family RNA polymerase sigma factor n=1 Tax=Clostridium sp. TaxID=1506 RepID=UPI0029046975|nr:sigma-70 family RNA polymerase sigma factor [Clostridium sp.]MDU2284160.1 sigma-70 family RNA polymerase sigma factor [Clostridium sp.]
MGIRVEDHLGIALDVANKISKISEKSFEEVYSDALEGLVVAASKFDKTRGLAFTTYAYPTVFGTVKRCFYKDKSKFKRIITDGKETYERVYYESLNEKVKTNDGKPKEKIELLESFSDKPLEDKVVDRIFLKKALNDLEEKEKIVLQLLFYKEKTQVEAGKILNMSQPQVSRLRDKALKKIRRKICS